MKTGKKLMHEIKKSRYFFYKAETEFKQFSIFYPLPSFLSPPPIFLFIKEYDGGPNACLE